MDTEDSQDIAEDTAAPTPVEAGEAGAPAVARMQTVEAWGAEKKFLPQLLPPPNFRAPNGAAGAGGVARIVMSGLSGPRANPKYYLYAQAKAGEQWPEGKELTESAFDEAITKHNSHVCR